jgi:glycine cleavage system H protein
MNPKDLKYTKEHEWIRVEGNTGVMGITDHAQELLTDIVFIELPESGKKVNQGETVAVLESVKAVSDVYSPVSGEITEVNSDLKDKVEMINKKPYTEGWIAKIKINDLKELNNLMTAEQYGEFLKKGH